MGSYAFQSGQSFWIKSYGPILTWYQSQPTNYEHILLAYLPRSYLGPNEVRSEDFDYIYKWSQKEASLK